MADDYDNRLTILERAQLLHDAPRRRRGEILDRHEDALARHDQQMAQSAIRPTGGVCAGYRQI